MLYDCFQLQYTTKHSTWLDHVSNSYLYVGQMYNLNF